MSQGLLWISPQRVLIVRGIDRQALTEVAASLVEETVRITRKTIRDAQVDLDDIANVVLVGGSTRMPWMWMRLRVTSGATANRPRP